MKPSKQVAASARRPRRFRLTGRIDKGESPGSDARPSFHGDLLWSWRVAPVREETARQIRRAVGGRRLGQNLTSRRPLWHEGRAGARESSDARDESPPNRANVTTTGRNPACIRSDTAANPDVGPKPLGGNSVLTLTAIGGGPWPAAAVVGPWSRSAREPSSHDLTLPSRASSGSPLFLATLPRQPRTYPGRQAPEPGADRPGVDAYDQLSRLVTVTQPWGGSGGGAVVTSYTYDVPTLGASALAILAAVLALAGAAILRRRARASTPV